MCYRKDTTTYHNKTLTANDITATAVRVREVIKTSSGSLPQDVKFLNGAAHPMDEYLKPNVRNLFYNDALAVDRNDKDLRYHGTAWSKVHWAKHKYISQGKDNAAWQAKYGDWASGYPRWVKQVWQKPREKKNTSSSMAVMFLWIVAATIALWTAVHLALTAAVFFGFLHQVPTIVEGVSAFGVAKLCVFAEWVWGYLEQFLQQVSAVVAQMPNTLADWAVDFLQEESPQ